MGVRGLQFYAEKVCGDEVCRSVNIVNMADTHRQTLKHDEKPIIVVDGMGLIRKLYHGSLDWAYGGQWKEFVLLLTNFVQCFQSAGIALIVFFDGPVCPEKRHEWVSRRERKSKDIENTFLKLKLTGIQPNDENDFQPPAGTGTLIRFALKFCSDVDVRSTVKEADIEIAEFARNNNSVFGILGQDSDFMVFDTKPYISLTHLNLETLTSVIYDRQLLAMKLSLSISQLPLFSCLLGNDTIPVELVKPFHRTLCQSIGQRGTSSTYLAPLISQMITCNKWRGDFRDEQEMSQICRKVFGGSYNVKLLQNGIMFYNMSPNKSGTEPLIDIVHCMHVTCENLPSVYGLHHNLEYDGSEVLEDYSDKSLPPANLAFRPVRQRAYTVLFQGSNFKNLLIKEWCSVPRRDLHQPELVPPLPIHIEGTLPAVEVLWRDTSPKIQDLKLQCFYACLGGMLKPSHMKNVQPKYQIFCCILNYFMTFGCDKKPLLAPWEVAAFIAQAIHPRAGDVAWLNALQVQHIDTRAVQLATLLLRGVTNFSIVLGICGYPIPLKDSMPWNFFNGKLFHSMYLKAKRGAKPDELCEYKAELIEEFHNLLSVIKVGTSLT